MIIMITSQGPKLSSPVNARFGRTPWFIKYDTENKEFEAFENPANSQPGGAGVSAGQFLVDHNTEVAISGRFGPNAHQVLSAAGIRMFTFRDDTQSIDEILKAFDTGSLIEVH